MKRVESHGVLMLVCLAGSMMSSLGVARADEFNDERLRAGQDAYVAKRYLEAIDQFRIAAFGSLDKPVVLDECLVRLALAQAAADKGADVRATLERFLEVESRFGGYAQARLQPEIRSAFRALLVSRVPQATILSIPSLAGLIETEEQKIARLPAAERRKALEAASKREPGSVVWMIALSRDALGQGDTRDADRWASKALATQPDNPDALALRARARAARGECVDALKDLAALTADQRTSRPELSADSFVCFVEVHNFDAAVEVSGRIPDNLASRPDVVQAKARLTSEQQRRAGGVAAASKAAGPKAAAPAPAASTTAGKAAEPPTPDPARTQVSLADARRLIATGKS
ncbi:MAG TPA: hypothetical protein VN032_05090, partial [Thermoanaerobaculia bacterium]|nr:hypothetical protein [Thermoanaerobaculia bacterium]